MGFLSVPGLLNRHRADVGDAGYLLFVDQQQLQRHHPQDRQRLGLIYVRSDVAKRIQLNKWPGDPEWDY
eukprot:14767079-Alexandrium_andersonii.AAC.1